jgi:hypothetical protein
MKTDTLNLLKTIIRETVDTSVAPLNILEKIAKNHLRIKSLRSLGNDSLDFHEVGVESLRAALDAAYAAGYHARWLAKRQRG